MNQLMNILGNVDRPYYFGVGGIGDFLLLMSTFYDNTIEDYADVVFVANNIRPLICLTNETKMFDKVHRFWFIPRSAVQLDDSTWEMLSSDKHCQGTGVTPKGFKYIEDWIRCNKEGGVFKYYGVHPRCKWAGWPSAPMHNTLVIQPFGGADDPTKIKEISPPELMNILTVYSEPETFTIDSPPEKIILIGSQSEMERLESLVSLFPNVEICYNMQAAVQHVISCRRFIGTDSWGKTLAKLAGREVTVYRNKYLTMTPDQMFGHPDDPGDYVFLENWEFEFKKDNNDVRW